MQSRLCPQPGSSDGSYRKAISACRPLPSIGSSNWPRQRRMTSFSGYTSRLPSSVSAPPWSASATPTAASAQR